MNILYVSRSHAGQTNPFVIEQASCVEKYHPIKVSHYFIENGIRGYIKTIFAIPKLVKQKKIDLVHVHNGLSAFFVILSKLLLLRSMKVVATFHGSDLNEKSKRGYSLIAAKYASYSIVVSKKMSRFLAFKHSVIPCGIDVDIELIHRDTIRTRLGWGDQDFVILFSSNFSRKEKDPGFAFKVVEEFSLKSDCNVKFIELKGYTRTQLTQIMQGADALILCSVMEGSPQVIKEAIINTLPVVANDVGDVAEICEGVDNCYVVEKTIDAYVDRLGEISAKQLRIKNRQPVINNYDNKIISNYLYKIYQLVLK